MIAYLDSSVVLRWLLKNSKVLPQFLKWETCYTSELLWIETNRVLNRLRLEKEITDSDFASLRISLTEFYETVYEIEMNHAVKKKAAEPFPTIIKTLDAIHLSTAILLKEENPKMKLIFLTHDKGLATAAMATGFSILGS